MGATPTPKRGRSRWDETPVGVPAGLGATPAVAAGMAATPLVAAGMTPMQTPMGGLDMATPTPSQLQQSAAQMTPEQYQACWPLASPRSCRSKLWMMISTPESRLHLQLTDVP